MVKLSAHQLVSILLESDRIAAAAVMLPDGGVITGSTHSSAWDCALRGGDLDGFLAKPYSAYSSESEAWEEIHGVMEDSLDGFVTEEGEFVGREEALRIALLSGQTQATLDRAGLPQLDAYALSASSDLDGLVEEAILLEAERITAAAVRLKDGTLLLGPTHSFCWDDALECGGLDAYLGKSWEEFGHAADAWEALRAAGIFDHHVNGFYTDAGRFVDREEAVAVAQAAAQLNTPETPPEHLDVDDMESVEQRYGEVLREAAKSKELPPWTKEYTHRMNGYPAMVTKNCVPGQLPWRVTWFDETDHEVIGHVALPFQNTRRVVRGGNTYYIYPLNAMQESTGAESLWISPSNQLIKVVPGHYAILHKEGLSEPDKVSVGKVAKILGNGPLAEDFYKEFEKAGWVRVVLCHQTKSVYLHDHSRHAQQRVAKDLAVEHRYRLVDDSAGEKVLWSPDDQL